MTHQATDLAKHVTEHLLERGDRTMRLLPTTAEKVQLAVAVATNVCGWAAGTAYGLTASNEPHPPASDLLRWVADQMDEARAALHPPAPAPSGGDEGGES